MSKTQMTDKMWTRRQGTWLTGRAGPPCSTAIKTAWPPAGENLLEWVGMVTSGNQQDQRESEASNDEERALDETHES